MLRCVGVDCGLRGEIYPHACEKQPTDQGGYCAVYTLSLFLGDPRLAASSACFPIVLGQPLASRVSE